MKKEPIIHSIKEKPITTVATLDKTHFMNFSYDFLPRTYFNDIPLFIPPKNPDVSEKGYEFGLGIDFVCRPYFIAILCSLKPQN